MTTIAVRVPLSDRADLEELLAAGGSPDDVPTEVHPFDGIQLLEIFLPLSATIYPYFRTWISSRVSSRKTFSIVVDGIELKGYTAAEAQSILERLQHQLEVESDEA